MTLLATRECDCEATYYSGKRPVWCEHGNRLLTPAELNRPARKPMRRVSEKRAPEVRRRNSTLKRGRGFAASETQREKVKGKVCVGCGDPFDWDGTNPERPVDPAHLWPRGMGGCNDALCVIPLCPECHGRFDDPSDAFDILPALIDRGYQAELAHPIAEHGVSLAPLLERVTGTKWAPVSEAVAA